MNPEAKPTTVSLHADQAPGIRRLRRLSFANYMTLAVITAYLPLYFDARGFSKLEIGILYSIGPTTAIVSNLFWGFLSDRFRTVKRMIIAVAAGQLAAMLSLTASESFTAVFAVMVAYYFFQTPLTPLTDSLTIKTIDGTRTSYASVRMWGSLGFAVSALVFGMVFKEQMSQIAIWVALFTILASLLLSFALIDRRGSNRTIGFSGIRAVIVRREILGFLAFILVISVAHRMNDGFLALTMREMGAGEAMIGWAWMISAASEIPMFLLLSRIGHKYKEPALLTAASLVYALRFALIGFVRDPAWIIPIQTLHSISFGLYHFTAIRYLQRMIPDEARASGQAAYAVVWSGLAGLLAGLFGGFLFEHFDGASVFRAAAVLAVLAAAGFAWREKQARFRS
jgi:PPP family 3-phenylpropionic acid transporter